MNPQTKTGLIIAALMVTSALTWCLAWIFYDTAKIWQTTLNTTYQNYLVLILALESIPFILAAATITTFKNEPVPNQPQTNAIDERAFSFSTEQTNGHAQRAAQNKKLFSKPKPTEQPQPTKPIMDNAEIEELKKTVNELKEKVQTQDVIALLAPTPKGRTAK
jgi:hypothetical protein